MTNQTPAVRRAAVAALLVAAALPLTPLAAQEAQPAAEQPAQAAEQPASETRQPVATTPLDNATDEVAPATEAEVAAERAAATPRATPPARRAPARAAPRPAPRATVRVPAASAAAPAALTPAPSPDAEVAPPADAAALPPGAVETLPETPAAGTNVVPVATPPEQNNDGSMLPWVLGALLLLGALAFLLMRRRRSADEVEEYHHDEPARDPVAPDPAPSMEHQEAPLQPTPAVQPEATIPPEPAVRPEPVRAESFAAPAPTAASPMITTAIPAAAVGASILTAPVIGAASASATQPAAAPAPIAPAGSPKIDLSMRPTRAGVQEDGARVEFELSVGNTGSVAAEEVRVSTWMLAGGSTEAERALIAPADHADTPPVTIPAGETRTLQAAVGLPTAEVDGDSVLPVVVADATYRMSDGSTGRATARFAVGVPDGEELAHFAVDNPSGLHEGVVARELGETERL